MADAAAFLLLWLAGWWLLWRVPAPGPAGGVPPPVSVVVPARDEAANLRRLLPTLAGAEEVVVVDDGSTDGTASVAREHGATVVDAGPLPAGWAGKPHACAVGAGAATHDLLVFLDADVRLEPGGLDRILGEHRGGLTSVQPHQVVPTAGERAAALLDVVAAMATGAFAPGLPRRGAFGPCLVTTRADYDAAGGHAHPDVRASVVEDLELARRYDRVRVLQGRGSASFRMHPGGLRHVVDGFSKNLAAGARRAHPVPALLTAGWVAATTAPVVLLWPVAYGLVALQVHVHLRRLGRFGVLTAALYPLPLAVLVVVAVRSVVAGRRVRWKGRLPA